jgi:hypothetical protein
LVIRGLTFASTGTFSAQNAAGAGIVALAWISGRSGYARLQMAELFVQATGVNHADEQDEQPAAQRS